MRELGQSRGPLGHPTKNTINDFYCRENLALNKPPVLPSQETCIIGGTKGMYHVRVVRTTPRRVQLLKRRTQQTK